MPAFEVLAAEFKESRLLIEIARIVAELGFPLAVRSSASAEDGSKCSFAGQFESYLNLATVEDVEFAVKKCRSSV